MEVENAEDDSKTLLEKYRNVVEGVGLTISDVEMVGLECGTQGIVHMNSDCQFVTIDFKNNVHESLSLFSKSRPTDAPNLDFVQTYSLYEKEATFYSRLLPDMRTFWIERAGCVDVLDTAFVKIYSVDGTSIVMENLMPKNYDLLRARDGEILTFEQSKLVLSALALLHGTTYAMIQNSGKGKEGVDLFRAKYSDCFRKSVYEHGNKFMEPYMDPVITYALKILNESDIEGSQETAEYLQLYETEMYNIFCAFVNEADQWIHVVNHGDCHVNNLMFQRLESDLINVKFVDFQTMNLTSVSQDLNFFIHGTIKLEDIKEKLPEMLKYYFDEFQVVVTTLGIEFEITIEDFLADYQKHALMGFLQAIRTTALYASFRIFAIPSREKLLEAIDAIEHEKKLKIAQAFVAIYTEFRDRIL